MFLMCGPVFVIEHKRTIVGMLIKTEPQKVNTETLSVFGTSIGSFVCKVVSSEFIFCGILQRSKNFVEHVLDVFLSDRDKDGDAHRQTEADQEKADSTVPTSHLSVGGHIAEHKC